MAAIARSDASRLGRPRRGVGRPPGVGVVLRVARDLRAGASQACPMSITSRLGRQTSASTASRSGATDHSSSSSRASVCDRVLADLDRAAGAERPAPGPGRDPRRARRPASQRPSASRTAQRTESEPCASSLEQPQRPADGLELDGEPAAGELVAGEAGGDAVVRGRAAVLEGGDRGVGLRAQLGGAARSGPPASASRSGPSARGRGRGCRESVSRSRGG